VRFGSRFVVLAIAAKKKEAIALDDVSVVAASSV